MKRMAEFLPMNNMGKIPDNTRGIYALLKQTGRNSFDVVYIGLSAGDRAGMWSRMRAHKRSKKLRWTHFTIFEVHDNIGRQEIKELEGVVRQIYRKDSRANKLNKQLQYKPFRKIRQNNLDQWT